MREHNAGVFQIRSIVSNPFKGNVTLIVYRLKGLPSFFKWNITLAHKTIGNLVPVHNGVLNVYIFYICAQISYSFFRLFVFKTIWVVNIPKSAYVVAGNTVQKVFKS